MRMWFAGPLELLRLPGQALQAVRGASALVPQLADLIGELQELVSETRTVVRDAHATQREAQAVAVAAEQPRRQVQAFADRAAVTAAAAAEVAAAAQVSSRRVHQLIDRFEPALHSLAPFTDHPPDGVTSDDASAVVEMIHTAPGLVEKLDTDIVPILNSLDTVAPDLRDVLDVSEGMNEMLGSVPGLGRVKRRIEKDQQEYRHRDHDDPLPA